MTKITINNATISSDAVKWCERNFQDDEWKMQMTNHWGAFAFEFKDERDATLFALRWAEYV
jgi:hypothetical protein